MLILICLVGEKEEFWKLFCLSKTNEWPGWTVSPAWTGVMRTLCIEGVLPPQLLFENT